MERQDELNATAASILGFLQQRPMSGYELSAEVAGSIGYFWNVTRSQLYRELKDLAARGYIALSETGAREKRVCSITKPGRKAFAKWISREPEGELIRYPLLLTLFFGDALDPERLRAWLRAHRERHAQRLAHYEQLVPQVRDRAPYPALTLEFGVEYERMVLRWVDKLLVEGRLPDNGKKTQNALEARVSIGG
ncbi:MAG TPA: helix-turn-helix transcriptional regulator [Candidatus Baltobacteraceae bacterium]|nr:helix-turn-helix transcriptional regulator [Candidatus Baltobacteraceae bacterium]